MTSRTGESLVDFLREQAKDAGKLYFAKETDAENAKSIVEYFNRHHNEEIMDQCVTEYVASEKDAVVTLGGFASKISWIVERIKRDWVSKRKFQELVETTRVRMEQDEL